MISSIKSLSEFDEVVKQNKAVLIYFSHNLCNVCKVLKPKINELLQSEFPQMQMFYCDTIEFPEIAAQKSIFAVPTIVIFFEGKEYIRKSRNIGVNELYNEVNRPYLILFN